MPIGPTHSHSILAQRPYYFIKLSHWRLVVLAGDDRLPFYYNSIRYANGCKLKRVSSQNNAIN